MCVTYFGTSPKKNPISFLYYQFSLLQHCCFEGRPFTSDIRNTTWRGGFKYALGGPNDLKTNPAMPTQASTQPTSLLQVDKPSTKTVGVLPGSWKSSRDLANVTQIPPILVGASEFKKKHADHLSCWPYDARTSSRRGHLLVGLREEAIDFNSNYVFYITCLVLPEMVGGIGWNWWNQSDFRWPTEVGMI